MGKARADRRTAHRLARVALVALLERHVLCGADNALRLCLRLLRLAAGRGVSFVSSARELLHVGRPSAGFLTTYNNGVNYSHLHFTCL